ncbi:MAG: hypothetical protein JW880_00155 [Candidatus Thermoplasmatota archaeon]|nr:hypothetical protein [Candidatus Thermoplasmatota archaeon]
MGRISRGWQLTKMSLRVVGKDKEILLFPLLSGIVTLLILGSFLGGMFMTGTLAGGESADLPWMFYAFWILFYFVSFFIGVFFNVAVIGCATIRMNGGDPTVRDGFRIAFENIRYIFMWTVFAATIGAVLRAIQQRAGIIGKFVLGALGMAFTIASYFAVPVFIYEKLGPWKALKRSVSILKSTWGEAIVGNLGLGIIVFLFALIGLLPIIIGVYIMTLWSIVIGVGIAVVYWVILGLVFSAAQSVLLAALYRYATTGKISEEFAGMSFANPFVGK